MKEYLISVIIPTRNRQLYAKAAVRQIISISDKIEVIVHDNSDDESLRDSLKDLMDLSQLKYVFIKERISAVDNYNYAAEMATGEYFIAIGDDDCLLPSVIECALWMKRNNIDAIKPNKDIRYWWPDISDRNYKVRQGYLSCGLFSNNYRTSNPMNGVLKLLDQGGQDYLNLDLVNSYHGLVKTDRMREVKKLTGRFYGGCSPDIYSAVCLSMLPNMKVVTIDVPISIPGICAKSTSSASGKGKHIGKLEDAPHFIGMKDRYNWNSIVPRIYSVETIWAECFLHALNDLNRQDLYKKFRRDKLYKAIIKNNPSNREQILKIIGKEADMNVVQILFMDISRTINRVITIGKRIVDRAAKRRYGSSPCRDIQEAETCILNLMIENNCLDLWNELI
ncbi:hypothetical protein IMSAGC020_00727 [Lachnospiraceae bacterium]|nr:hypothetical protein IMSAGC020_00727 [Lachnospiraceae bacterium]